MTGVHPYLVDATAHEQNAIIAAALDCLASSSSPIRFAKPVARYEPNGSREFRELRGGEPSSLLDGIGQDVEVHNLYKG